MYGDYSTPCGGLKWDDGNPPVNSTNINKLANGIVDVILGRASAFHTNNVLFPWGTDFEVCLKELLLMKLCSTSHVC